MRLNISWRAGMAALLSTGMTRSLLTKAHHSIGHSADRFAYEIFRMLDVYSSTALEAWYVLFKSGDTSKFYELANAG